MADSTKKVALVTGGAKRVGRAIVQKLAGAGFDVAFTYTTSGEEATQLANSLSTDTQKVIAIPADLTHTRTAVDFIVCNVEHHFGRLDALVNSASIYKPTPLDRPFDEVDFSMFSIHYY